MSKTIKRTNGSGAEDRLTPFEVAVLSRVVRASVTPEADLVFAWGTGPWAALALDGLLTRELVRHGFPPIVITACRLPPRGARESCR